MTLNRPLFHVATRIVPGRDTWYAGSAIVDGKRMGPPLGIRSITWQPTIDIDSDVHQVCAHPTRPDIVMAAAGAGLCMSRDAGATWTIELRGFRSHHCYAVAFGRNDLFVAAAADPFTAQGAVYRRPIDSNDPLQPLGGDMSKWIDGNTDTNCIATRDSMVAVIDRSGRLYVSHDDGASWSSLADRLTAPSGLHIC